MRFYECRTEGAGDEERFFIIMKTSQQRAIEVEVPRLLKDELDDLQREYWKQEKREQRHTVHIEAIPDCYLPHSAFTNSPESALVKKLIAGELEDALLQIPTKQQRRFILRHVFDIPIRKIASIEKCSERAVKYSIELAKKNLKDILGEDFLH